MNQNSNFEITGQIESNGVVTSSVIAQKGAKGEDAKINGYNTLNIVAGENVNISQSNNTLEISSDNETNYENFSNLPKINDVLLKGNKTLGDLGIDQDFVKDDSYVHTDNNFTDTYKQKITTNESNIETLTSAIEEHDQDIQNIKNDIDTLEQDIDSLGTEIDNLELNKQNKLTAGTNITIDENNVISATGSGGTSDFDQLTNRPKYNGTTMTHSTNIPEVPTKTSDITNDSNFVSDSNYVHTDNNFTSAEKTKLEGIEAGAEVNNVNDVKVNGTSIVDENKVANIDVEEAQEIIIDTSVTQSSSNLITSGAVYEAVNNKVSDVQVNGSSIVDEGIANIPIGSTSTAGVLRADTSYGTRVDNTYLRAVVRTYSQYQSDSNNMFVGKGTLENVITGKHLDRPEIKTTLDTPLQVNTIYDLDDVSSLTLQLPQGQVGDFIQVQFLCKTTATALSITSAYGMTDLDLTPEVGNTYSIYGEWGKVDTDTYGWKLSSFEASIPTI